MAPPIQIIFESLDEQGWYYSDPWSSVDMVADLAQLASQLGTLAPSRRNGPIIDILQPTTSDSANPKSLSSKFGLCEFPFHTDTAYWNVPSRYIALRCMDPGVSNVTTRLVPSSGLNLSDQVLRNLQAGVFHVLNGRNSFYTSVMSDCFNLRFDPGCMSPTSSIAHEGWDALSDSLATAIPISIDWEQGRLLVIDNWRVLHGRAALPEDSGRVLIRATIKSANPERF
jgi:hypothetical protein